MRGFRFCPIRTWCLFLTVLFPQIQLCIWPLSLSFPRSLYSTNRTLVARLFFVTAQSLLFGNVFLIAGACPCPPRKTAEHSNTIAKRVAKIGCGCSVETCFCKRPRKMFFFLFTRNSPIERPANKGRLTRKTKQSTKQLKKKTKQSTKQPNRPLTHPPNQMAQIDAKKRLCLSVSHVAVGRSRLTQKRKSILGHVRR